MVARTDSACKFICERGDWQVTNLQLQKILYITQMVYLGEEGERLFDSVFQAWDHGPVAPSVYRKVRMFGSKPIKNVFFDARSFVPGSKKRRVLSDACRDLLTMRPGQLVEITHWADGAWAKHYVPGERGIAIPDTAIEQEFRDRVKAGHITPD